MSCSNGVCAPTASKAVLNVGDLESLLASGNVAVTTTGAGVQANDIHVSSALAWSNSNTLSLEAHRSLAVGAAISVTGLSGLTLDSGKNGALSFGKKGNVTFGNLSSQLMINGISYTLVGDIDTLANDIVGDSGGSYALAANYDASGKGYNNSPIQTEFDGTFDGLGNTISNLSLGYEGLFLDVGAQGTLRDVGLLHVSVGGVAKTLWNGSLAGLNQGSIENCYASGNMIVADHSRGGGLIGDNVGTVSNSYSMVTVKGAKHSFVGSLVGINTGAINASYATGAVSTGSGSGLLPSVAGALVGGNNGAISNSYATGAVTGGVYSTVGGLLGGNSGPISFSYSTGAVTGGTGSLVGGLIGDDEGTNTDNYWDTDTSGITNLSQGAGNIANDPGITGLTTAQFQSGLPAGFDPAVWAEKSNINGGLPYLLSNPPQHHK